MSYNCKFIFKNNKNCNNKIIENSDFCHIKSHHNDLQIYNNIINYLKFQFEFSTLSLNNFIFYDVTADGACAYRCMGRLLSEIKDFTITDDSDYMDELKRLLTFVMNDNIETKVANLLQQIIREWIMVNRNKYIENLNCFLKNFVTLCHELSDIYDYNNLYKIFAGDDVPKYTNDRWAGTPEFYAFAYIFNIKVSIYTIKKFNEKTCSVVRGYIRNPSSRLQLYQSFNENNDVTHFRFLHLEKYNGHYLYIKEKITKN